MGVRKVAAKKQDDQRFSESIGAFCKMMEKAKLDYKWSEDGLHRMDGLTQDYLHQLELDDLDYRERAKIATQLAKCRKERREYKDTMAALEPLVQFLDSEKGRNLQNLMNEALGKTRKVEERLASRTYFPRVLKSADWNCA